MLFNHDVNGIQQALQIPLLYKRRPEIRHDEIAYEQNALIRQVDEHRIVSFSSLHRNQLDSGSPDLQLRATVDGDVRLEAAKAVGAVAFTEELFIEDSRRSQFASNLFL